MFSVFEVRFGPKCGVRKVRCLDIQCWECSKFGILVFVPRLVISPEGPIFSNQILKFPVTFSLNEKFVAIKMAEGTTKKILCVFRVEGGISLHLKL